MNEDKPEKPVTEQSMPAQPTTDPATAENSANTADQSEASSSEATAQASLGEQALQSAESTAAEVEQATVTSEEPLIAKPEAEQSDSTEAVPVGESAAGDIEQPSTSEEPLIAKPEAEQSDSTEAVPVSESGAGVGEQLPINRPTLDKPGVDDARIQALFTGFIEGKKAPRLNQKKLAKLLKKVIDILNDSGELPKRFTFGARDVLAEPAADRMLSQGIDRNQLEKAFALAGVNLIGVQQQITFYAQETSDQPLTVVDAVSVKRAKQADAFCGLYPWC